MKIDNISSIPIQIKNDENVKKPFNKYIIEGFGIDLYNSLMND